LPSTSSLDNSGLVRVFECAFVSTLYPSLFFHPMPLFSHCVLVQSSKLFRPRHHYTQSKFTLHSRLNSLSQAVTDKQKRTTCHSKSVIIPSPLIRRDMASLLWSYARPAMVVASGLSLTLAGALYYFQKCVHPNNIYIVYSSFQAN